MHVDRSVAPEYANVYQCMCVCVHMCMYFCLHVCMFKCMPAVVYVCEHICLYLCTNLHMNVCMHIHMHGGTHACVRMHAYCFRVWDHKCIYVRIHRYIQVCVRFLEVRTPTLNNIVRIRNFTEKSAELNGFRNPYSLFESESATVYARHRRTRST